MAFRWLKTLFRPSVPAPSLSQADDVRLAALAALGHQAYAAQNWVLAKNHYQAVLAEGGHLAPLPTPCCEAGLNLALIHYQDGKLAEALDHTRKVAAARPDYEMAWLNLSLLLKFLPPGGPNAGGLAPGAPPAVERRQALMAAAALNPEGEAPFLLAEWAIDHGLQAEAGLPLAAIRAKNPDHLWVRVIDLIAAGAGTPDVNSDQLRQAILLAAETPPLLRLIITAAHQRSASVSLLAAAERLFALMPDDPDAEMWIYSAASKLRQFNHPCFARAGTAQTLDYRPVTTRLFGFSYHPTLPPGNIAAEFAAWGKAAEAAVAPLPPLPPRRPGPLRIGYLSPDFRFHSCYWSFLPLLSSHDRAKFQFFAYSNVRQPDEFTAKLRPFFDHWRDIRALNDGQAAAQIRADEIDVLVDATGHMADHRLGITLHHPARVHAFWLGSAWTTGLTRMDYVIHSNRTTPPGAEQLVTEKLFRLPRSFFVYVARDDAPVPNDLPALENGHVTFGYTGRLERLNRRVFAAWKEILDRLPGARLIVDYPLLQVEENRADLAEEMAACGIDVARVTLTRSKPVWAALAKIDILLDSFPHSGGTMLFDTLWGGVPFITRADRPPVGRLGADFLGAIGLDDLIAENDAEFADKAVALANDLRKLAALRAQLRDRVRNSELCDGPGFARAMEAAYESMLREQAARQSVR